MHNNAEQLGFNKNREQLESIYRFVLNPIPYRMGVIEYQEHLFRQQVFKPIDSYIYQRVGKFNQLD